MTTHQEALEAAGKALQDKYREFWPGSWPAGEEARSLFEAGQRAYLATLAPADNGLVERYGFRDDKFVALKKGSYVSFSDYEALQADRTAQAAEIERLKAERDELRAYAERLARQLHFKHYKDNPGWKPLSGDLIGMMTQIDNMTSGLERSARLSALEALLDKAGPIRDLLAALDQDFVGEACKDEPRNEAVGGGLDGPMKLTFGMIDDLRDFLEDISTLTAIQEARHAGN